MSTRRSSSPISKSGRDELISLLAPRPGHFVLPSGRHGDLWVDLRAVFADPERVRPFARALARRLASYELDGVVGAPEGGALLAEMLDRPAPERLDGKRVAVIDDVISVGTDVATTMRALEVRGASAVVLGALAVVGDDSIRLASLAGLPIECLARLDSEIRPAEQCGLCAAGVPLG